ncbi:DUF3828 domain-containing protein [Cronobacter turicensis]|uniref:DUF3828 domain-containing protein n=1 Tax=Cronobacter turicensis TaxID=413502 RepID=UPI0014135627|nr:DUF3828 domain-containing protein [Cronobacter turicensis]NHV08879.1 DUF3828 domain-containing protein [Cronobacter turicensis]NHV62235.1 DUF3828 domain-containing protein [Cronobacter turicensis]NHW09176.1 DUF3828 domain-containing protein [Cronobacter turicensis]
MYYIAVIATLVCNVNRMCRTLKINNSISRLATVLMMAACFSSVSFGQESEVAGSSISSPEDTVKQFYFAYLTAWGDPDIKRSLADSEKAVSEYTTQHLRNLMQDNDTGADYFTSAQEACRDWVYNIFTNNLELKKNTADINLSLGYNRSKSVYQIHLIKKQGRWLMDSVKIYSRVSETCNQQ